MPPTRPTAESPKAKLNRESLAATRFLLGYLKPYRGKFAIAIVALLISSLAGLAFPGLTGSLIDAATKPEGGRFGDLNTVTAILFGVLVAQSAFSYVRTYFLMEVSERSLADLRRDLYQHVLRLPMRFFHQHRVGELSSRISADIGSIQMTITTTLSELIRQSVILIGGVALIAYTSTKLTAIILTAVPILVVLTVLFGRAIRKAGRRMQDLYAELNTVVEETFQGISIVKSFTAEHRESRRYMTKLQEVIAVSLGVARARGGFVAFILFILFGGIVAVVWYGGRMVQEGTLTIGELTSFVLYAVFVGGAMGSFADLYASVQRAVGASERVRELFESTAEVLPEPSPTRALTGHVELRGVSFAYATRPDVEVLKGVTLDVPAGSSLAIVGPSGAGKSTLAGLLMRFYEPTAGELVVDGRNALEYPLSDFRASIAIVPQDVSLFGGTIAENIAYGAPGATIEAVREAARQANALEFIEGFPEGFETIVGERGVQLSGGQRQRVAIARAIIKDPSVLILDEATSSLDSESERLVQSAVERLMKDRTTFVIAHRLSTIRNADRIAVIRAGTVAEYGSYAELMAMEGVFARLVSMQQRFGGDVLDEASMIE
ncbi:MAG TPA: ABC transporter ATP-binding protein [Candidatus Kapabacteria bacterium]|nr:ABC transporter ATP-binding protein [Candidatus Kapabacteria bacterium]